MIDGLRIGGHAQLLQFRCKTAPFEVIGNPTLQHVLDLLAEGCYTSYADVDHDRAKEVYGVSWPTATAPKATGEIFHLKKDWLDDILAQDSDDDDSATVPQPAPVPAPQAKDADPCVIKHGLLTTHKRLNDVLRYFHGRCILQDKSPDLFAQERGHWHLALLETVPRDHGSGVATTTTSATSHHEIRPSPATATSHAACDALSSPSSPHISPTPTPIPFLIPDPSSTDLPMMATSSSLERSSSRKRGREDDDVEQSQAASADRVEESNWPPKRRA